MESNADQIRNKEKSDYKDNFIYQFLENNEITPLNKKHFIQDKYIGFGHRFNVYTFIEKITKQKYAVKVLKFHKFSDIKKSLYEIKILLPINHPSIIKFIGCSLRCVKKIFFQILLQNFVKMAHLKD